MNSFYFPGESHPFWEFVCVDKGEVTIGAGDRSFVLTRGQIVFHRPDEFHWVRAGGKAAPNLIVISFSTGSPLMDFSANGSCRSPSRTVCSLRASSVKPAYSWKAGWTIRTRKS